MDVIAAASVFLIPLTFDNALTKRRKPPNNIPTAKEHLSSPDTLHGRTGLNPVGFT